MSEDTFDREITPLKRIRDNYPKYIITMDEMPMDEDEDGIKIKWIIDRFPFEKLDCQVK